MTSHQCKSVNCTERADRHLTAKRCPTLVNYGILRELNMEGRELLWDVVTYTGIWIHSIALVKTSSIAIFLGGGGGGERGLRQGFDCSGTSQLVTPMQCAPQSRPEVRYPAILHFD
jgi:hypothetical protein